MQAYGAGFARVYNARWGDFARRVAPIIEAFYASTPLGRRERSLLDICCGTGQMAVHFLQRGYRVTGVDLSLAMIGHATQNTAAYVESGQARFVLANACEFSVDGRFGLATATYDALNHLPDLDALATCLRRIHAATMDGGLLIFDLNTRRGLEAWNSIQVDDNEDLLLVNRSIFDRQAGKAWARLSGFAKVGEGLYERFEEVVYNTAFDLESVRSLLLETGWNAVHIARLDNLGQPLTDPEAEARAWFVASR